MKQDRNLKYFHNTHLKNDHLLFKRKVVSYILPYYQKTETPKYVIYKFQSVNRRMYFLKLLKCLETTFLRAVLFPKLEQFNCRF